MHTDNLPKFFELAKQGKHDEIICCVPFMHPHITGTGTIDLDIFEILKKGWGAIITDHDEEGKNIQYVRSVFGTCFNLDYSHEDGTVTLGYLKDRQE
jgi:hypothetical protein